MSKPFDVVAVVGSLRRESYTRRIVQSLIPLAPDALALEVLGVGELALYDQDAESDPPTPWVVFRERVKRADAVLFATPEYNRSIPGVLKNAIDVGSRPYGSSAWSGKPAAVLSCSPGVMGAFGANQHLRQSLVFLNMPTMQQPEAYLGGADKMFAADGDLVNASTKQFLIGFLTAFEAWIRRQTAVVHSS
jgi:chromate reductase, NAD(P)H dehydrogenase (quinone)